MYWLTFLILFCTSFTNALVKRKSGGTCVDVNIPLYVEAQNLDLSILSGFVDHPATFLASTTAFSTISGTVFNHVPISGNETIAASYCEPNIADSTRHDTLQLLVHGITYTRDYWDATPEHYQPANYSWVDYALAQGYPVLAIDRLGSGLSSHPDPFTHLQVPYEVRATHALIEKIRHGTTGVLPRAFSKVIYVGHSFGSILGNVLINESPQDVDAVVLTGFSNYALPALVPVAQVVLVPAALFSPSRFGNLSPGYLTTSRKAGRQYALYYNGFYDPAIFEIDWATEGVVGAAELVTGFMSITSAPSFEGLTYVQTGNQDTIFCSPVIPNKPGNCGSGSNGRLARTAQLFPAARPYSFDVIQNAGHDINFHFAARQAFDLAHQFFSDAGF